MGDNSAIEWTEASWNPTTGCTQISPGCANCYAKTLAKRLKAMGQSRYQNDGGKGSGPGFALTLQPDVLELPLRWKRPRRIFVDSMSDLFHEDVPFEYIDKVFAVMALTPQHTYQCLTKRPERMREYMSDLQTPFRVARHIQSGAQWSYELPFEWPLPGVWAGVTVENQHWADIRIPILLDTPAAVRFLSCEPLLGPVDLRQWLRIWTARGSVPVRLLHWVIVGGESGPRHRPFDPDWARSIVAQCREAGVSCFVKQLGGLRPGNKLEDLPEDLRVREFPE